MRFSFHCPLYATRRSVSRPSIILIVFFLSCLFFIQINLAAAAAPKGTPVEDTIARSKRAGLSNDVKPLQVGDKMPDLEFEMMNYTSPTARFSDFRGKLVIFDFWATWCGSCIEHFPENEKLMKEFGDKLQILLVSQKEADSRNSINKFLKKQEDKNIKLSLPTIVNDSLISNYFPHFLIPHYAWINGDGEVIAVTASNEVTSKNVKKVLSGEKLVADTKDDNEMMNDFTKPYLFNNKNRIDSMLTGSFFTGAMRMDVAIQQTYCPSGGCRGVRYLNYPLFFFFRLAYPEMGAFYRSTTLLNVADSNLIDNHKELIKDNKFCYEFITSKPLSLDTIMQKYLREDLYKSFHYKGRVESREVVCYVITRKPATEFLQSTIKKSQVGAQKNIDIVGEKISLSEFITMLNDREGAVPVVNETGSLGKDSIFERPIDIHDFYSIEQCVTAAGYRIFKASRTIPFFILSEE